MVRFRGSSIQEETEISRSVLGEDSTGDIAVVISGEPLDFNLVSLGCYMGKGARRKILFVYVIEVPHRFPLKAVLTQESERADTVLKAAMQIAEHIGCEAITEIVQTRDAGSAIVDEARDLNCVLILIGFMRLAGYDPDRLGKTVPYVLANACCRVLLVQDP